MSEVIKRWVACKTGVEPDLEPRALRRLLADGTLLARLLHSYFVVDAALREQVRATDDPELRRKNWAVLRRWLLLVGLELADDVINEIAEARGSTAGLLLYQLFLRLECLGKEQAMSQAGPVPRARKNSRFEVLPTVDVAPPAEQTFDHVATRPTRPAQWGAVGEWYTQRYAAALAHVNAGRQDFRRAVEARLRRGSPASPPRGADAAPARLPPCMPPETVADGKRQPPGKSPPANERASKRLTGHAPEAEKHVASPASGDHLPPPPPGNGEASTSRPARGERLEELLAGRRRGERLLQGSAGAGAGAGDAPAAPGAGAGTEDAARLGARQLRQRARHARRHADYQRRMERLLPTELLTLAKKARADFFDEEIAQKLAQQSQFEKQMVTKLLQVRRERVVVEDNFWMARDVMKELLETVKAASAPEEASPLANNAEKLIFKERTLSFYKWMLAEQRKEAAEENLRICEEVVSVLVDLALHAAEYREITEGEVPQRVMDEWNTMIFANYPLLDMTDQEELVERLEKLEKLKNLSVFGEDEDSMWASSNLCKQLAKEAALDRVAVREYIDLKGRWDPSRCEKDLDLPSESGVRVLGHVVHRLLLLRYPFKALPEAAKLPPRTVAAALLGVRDPRSRRVLRRLLEAQRVLLVEPEAAVADCVERFQQENVPEDTEDEITEAPAKSIEEEKEPTPPKPDRSSKKPSKKSSKPLAAQSQRQSVMLEKEVQAPPLPEEEGAGAGAGATTERVLAASPSARGRLGRVLVEQLAAGRHLTPEMLVQAIVRHLEARLDGKWRGWVLLDMPRTHAQALHLEQHLTGQPVPPAPDEEWARHPLRTLTPFVFEDELEAQREVEDFLRQSQIFPNPTPPEVPRVFLPYLTMVVTARHEHCKTIRSNESATEVCPDHASFVEKLYANVGLSYSFYYRRLDLAALKFLARALLYSLGDDYDVEEKWKELLDELQKEMGSLKEFSPSDLKKRVMRENFVFEHLRRTSVEPEIIVKGLMTDMTSAQFGPIAGQYGWIYADMDLKDVGCVLAKSWEAAEGEYLRGLAEVLTLLRGHSTAAAPFMQGTRAAVRRLLEAPEPKQTPADIFQLQLGELTPEMREDPEVKAEWHLRAVELRQQLCDICERHRHDAEAARRTIATDIWIAVELAFVANLMIMMAQLELNFFASALQVIQDYYLTMLEKPLHTDKLPRYTLSRMELSEVLKPPPEPGAGAGETPPPGGSKTASKDSSPSGSRASQLAPPSTSRPSTRRSTSVSVTGAAGGPRASGRPSRVREGTGGGSLSGATHSGRPSVTRGIIDTTAVALAAVLLQPPAPEEAGDSAGSSAIVSQQSSTASPTPPHQSISGQPQQQPVASPGSASTVESGGNGARASVQTPPPATATSIVTPVHAFVTDALAAAAAKMDALAGAAADVQRREGSASGKARAAASPDKAGEPDQRPSGKAKKPNSTAAASLDGATSTAPPTEEPEPMPEPERAVQEWAAAVATLHQRALFRLQLIECRAHLQFGDFLTDIFALFHGLHDEINGRYEREVAAVDMLIDILQLTIEDEEPIGAQLVLEGDGLFMRPDRLMAKPFAPLDIPLASLDAVQSRISIAQLTALSKRLQGLAPSGLMAERALLEQLVELTSISAGDGDNRPLPPTWEALGPLGLQALLERVFGKAEVVDWRDLIIRCLELPWPTERQILEQREKYAEHDPNRLELLSSDIFLSVELWFEAQECEEEEEEEEVDRIPKIKKLLQMLFKGFNELVNYTAMLLHFCKDAEPVAGLGKALALATGCRVVKNERDERARKQEALRPLGRRLASFEKEARDVATCAVERLVGDAVRASESPYLAWLPDEHRAAVWKALLGDEPCQPPGPTPAPSPSSPPIPTPTPPGTPSYPSRGSDAADVVQGLFGGFFKKPPQSPQQRGSAKKAGKDHEAQLYVHDYMEMPIRVVLEESRENIKEKDVKTPENESAHEGFEDLMDSPIIPCNDTTPEETGEEAKEEEETDERVSLGDYDEKSPWLTQLPFDLVLAVLSSALSGLIRTPPPILLGRKAESYPLFRGLIDLLTCIYSELGEDQLNKWTVSSMKLMSHPLLQELLSFTTLHFVAGSIVETVWSILNEYGLEVLTPTPLNA